MVRKEYIGGYEYFMFELGDVTKKERRNGRWRIARTMNQKQVYFGCPYCNAICWLDPRVVNKDGLTRHSNCPECGEAFRSKFIFWEEYLEEQKKGGS